MNKFKEYFNLNESGASDKAIRYMIDSIKEFKEKLINLKAVNNNPNKTDNYGLDTKLQELINININSLDRLNQYCNRKIN